MDFAQIEDFKIPRFQNEDFAQIENFKIPRCRDLSECFPKMSLY